MSVIVDIILILIFASSVFLGIKRGFIGSVMGLASVIIAVIAANLLTSYIAPFYRSQVLEKYVGEPVQTAITEYVREQTDRISEVTPDALKNMPELLGKISGTFGIELSELKGALDKTDTDGLPNQEDGSTVPGNGQTENDDEEETNPAIASLSAYVVSTICGRAADVLAFFTVFIVAFILLRVVTVIIGAVFKMPVLKGLNKTAGALFGVVCGALIVFILGKIYISAQPLLTTVKPELFGADAGKSFIIGLLERI